MATGSRNGANDVEWNRMRRFAAWGVAGLIILIGALIVASLIFPGPRPFGAFFFPFHFGWLGGIFMILVIFWVARWFFWPWRRWGYYQPASQYREDDAQNILRARYARGEITKEQYEQMTRDLERAS